MFPGRVCCTLTPDWGPPILAHPTLTGQKWLHLSSQGGEYICEAKGIKIDVFKTSNFSLSLSRLEIFLLLQNPNKMIILSQGAGYFYHQDASEFPAFFSSAIYLSLGKKKGFIARKSRLIFSQSILNFHKDACHHQKIVKHHKISAKGEIKFLEKSLKCQTPPILSEFLLSAPALWMQLL